MPEESASGWDTELQIAVSAARAGADAALPFFRKQSLVTWKADDSPVGEADHAADAAIQQCIRAAFPDDTVLTEESGERAGRPDRRWIVDPIDGTRIAPFVVLLEEAGARFTDLTGTRIWPCRSGLAAAPRLHDAVLDVLRDGRSSQ